MLARKFLFIIAGLIVLTLVGAFAFRLYGPQLMRAAFVPGARFVSQEPFAPAAYANRAMWHARPDLPGNPALWLPDGFKVEGKRGDAAIFFVHPTSYLDRSAWNAPLNDKEANDRAALFLRGQASAFNGAGEIWAPRYRQATFGAFLTSEKAASFALDAAYADVLAAWDAFAAAISPDRPIIVAGHSQGALHLMRLLRDRIAGRPIADRIVAAYVVGWPVSLAADIPAMGLPACERADQIGCVLSWQSFAEPADPSLIFDTYNATTGPTGIARKGTPMLCTNPITGTPSATASANANLGTIVPSTDLKTGRFEAGKVPARCDTRGFLLIGSPPEGIATYVLPGNNYHVFDYTLFWANVRADAARRLAAYESAQAAQRPLLQKVRATASVQLKAMRAR